MIAYWIGVFVVLCISSIICLDIAKEEGQLTLRNVLVGTIVSLGSWGVIAAIAAFGIMYLLINSGKIVVWKKKEPWGWRDK